jgi:acyl-CoA dehydrogenase
MIAQARSGGEVVNFEFSDDQRLLRDQVRRFLDDNGSVKAARAILDDDGLAYDKALWRSIVELGWTGAIIPEEFGGAGMIREDLCVIAEELGRSLAPTPFASSVYLVTEALLIAGDEGYKSHYLPELASGESIGCFAMAEGIGIPTPANVKTTFLDGKLNGVKKPVLDGDIADFAIVVARTADAGDESLSLALVDLTADGVGRDKVSTVDPTRSQAEITFDGASAELLGGVGQGYSLMERIFDRAAIYLAFEQVGGAQAALDMAVDYSQNRFAFGRAIGSFQAIKHKLVNIYVDLELARANAYYGAWAMTNDAPDLPIAAAAARVSASEAFNHAARENIQTHGGMGFTWEFDCHLYYRRAKQLSLAIGGERRWTDRLITKLEQRNAP